MDISCDLVSFYCIWLSILPNTNCWRGFPFSSVWSWLLYQRLTVLISVGLFLGSVFQGGGHFTQNKNGMLWRGWKLCPLCIPLYHQLLYRLGSPVAGLGESMFVSSSQAMGLELRSSETVHSRGRWKVGALWEAQDELEGFALRFMSGVIY